MAKELLCMPNGRSRKKIIAGKKNTFEQGEVASRKERTELIDKLLGLDMERKERRN